jgi:hypothetical protein
MLATILQPQRDISEENAKFINKNQNKTESNASSVRSQLQYSQLQTAVYRTPLVKRKTIRHSGLSHRSDRRGTDISEEHFASIFRVEEKAK